MIGDWDARWRQTLLPREATLAQAVRNLDASGLQIALVVDARGVLLGTVTDGDIRRSLLCGPDLDRPVHAIMARTPLVVPPQMRADLVLHLMRANHVHQIPVVDADRRVVGLHVWDAVTEPVQRDNLVVIMAGGLGSRLRPLTEDCPKPMLRVAGKPILEHIIERARGEGFRRFVLSLYYLGHVIEGYFGDGARLDVEIRYLREASPLGTAGAVTLLDPAPGEPFLVTNGDVLTDIRYGELLDFHLRHGADATMAVRLHEWQCPFGTVRTRGIDIVGLEEKPVHRSHVNAGIYVLGPTAHAALTAGEPCDMPQLFERLRAGRGRCVVYPMHEPWLDIGRPEDLRRAKAPGCDR